jgi:hypothetical protein
MTAIDTIQRALEIIRKRLIAAPTFDFFISTEIQLTYLLSLLTGEESDRSRLKNIIVGHFAVREFEESDPELAEALVAAQNIASKMAKGLKV